MALTSSYESYLASDAWKQMRMAKLFLDGKYDDCGFIQCEDCRNWFGPGGIEIHHKTYARVGSERLDDLAILCCVCHGTHHNVSLMPQEVYQALASSFGGIYETRVQALRKRFSRMVLDLIAICRSDEENVQGSIPKCTPAAVKYVVRNYWDIRELMRTEEIQQRIYRLLVEGVYKDFDVKGTP